MIYNVQLERSLNSQLLIKDHILETDRSGDLVYTQKKFAKNQDTGVKDDKSLKKLEHMLALKSKYKEMSLNGGEPEPLKGYGIQEDPVKVEISGK